MRSSIVALVLLLAAGALGCGSEGEAVGAALAATREAEAALSAELLGTAQALDGIPAMERSEAVQVAQIALATPLGANERLGGALAVLAADSASPHEVAAMLELATRLRFELDRVAASLPAQGSPAEEPLRTAVERASSASAEVVASLGVLFERVVAARPIPSGAAVPDYAETHRVRLMPGVEASAQVLRREGGLSLELLCGLNPQAMTVQLNDALSGALVAEAGGTGSASLGTPYETLLAAVLFRISVHTPDWQNFNDGSGGEPPACELVVAYPGLVSAPARALDPTRLQAIASGLSDFDSAASHAHLELANLRAIALQDPSAPQAAVLDEIERAAVRAQNALSRVPGIVAAGAVHAEVAAASALEGSSSELEMIQLQSALSQRGQALELLSNMIAAMNDATKSIIDNIDGDGGAADGGV